MASVPPEISRGSLEDRLRAVAIFASLDPEDLAELARAATLRPFRTGDLLVRQDESGEELYVLLDGECRAFLRQEALQFEKELALFRPGQYFGEIGLFAGGNRSASVRAATDGTALVLKKEDVERLLPGHPSLVMGLLAGMAKLVRSYARESAVQVPLVGLDQYPNLQEVVGLLPPRIALFCESLVIERQGRVLTVAMVDPYDRRTRDFLQDVLRGHTVHFAALRQEDFNRFAERHLQQRLSLDSRAEVEAPDVAYASPSNPRPNPLGGNEPGIFLRDLFHQAVRIGASDIHVTLSEIEEGAPFVRLRLDGRLAPYGVELARHHHPGLVQRLKIMADLDITEKRQAQDGRFELILADTKVEVRASSMPCRNGEKLVFRLLDPQRRKPDLDAIVVERTMLEVMKDAFLNPSGLVLVTGPTGSGKTTTLNAGLEEIWRSSRTINIVTIEDPVEYHLPFATQISVNRQVGMDFPRILRTVLRQDPNVILVGEIRDEESALVALDAATTGHLVLSSLHTHFAAETLVRLRHLNIPSYLLADAVKAVISQRLIGRLCPACAGPIAYQEKVVQRLRDLGVLDADDEFPLLRGTGCEACRGEGEVGRVAVFEILLVDGPLRAAIERHAPADEIARTLSERNYISMARYGRRLLQDGLVGPDALARIFPPPV